LTDVQVDSGAEGTAVTLVGLSDPIYTADYDADLRAVVVELPWVDGGAEIDRVDVYDGIVDHITTTSYAEEGGDSVTRVEIGLGSENAYALTATEDGLRIEFGQYSDEISADDTWAEEDLWAEAEASDVSLAEEPAEEPVEEAVAEAVELPAPPVATQLSSIDVTVLSDGILIHFTADGSVWSVESLVLQNPDRLVVDLLGMKMDPSITTVEVDHAMVSGIRVGAHADKTRVVVDGGAMSLGFTERSVKPSADGLFVVVGSGEDVDLALTQGLDAADAAWAEQAMAKLTAAAPVGVADAMPSSAMPSEEDEQAWVEGDEVTAWDGVEAAAWDEDAEFTDTAEAPASLDPSVAATAKTEDMPIDEVTEATNEIWNADVAEVTPAKVAPAQASLTSIHGVHYTAMDSMDRIAVLCEGEVEYKVHSPDADTFVLSLFSSTISSEVAGRIRGEAGGPVSLVTIFEQPEMDTSEVRLVVTRAPNQEPVISRHGTLLFIDFQRLGVAAAAPPAFPETESTGLTLASADEPVWDEAEVTEPVIDEALATSLDESEEQLVAQAASVDELPEFSENPALDGPAGLDQGFAEDDTTTAVMDDEFASLSGPLDDFDETDDADLEMEGPASLEPPAAVEVLQEGGITDGKQYVGRRISLDFKDVPVSDVLRLIAEVSDLNLIAGDEVKGAVTIRLVDTPWDQALDVVLLTKGLGFVRVGNILRVAPADVLAAEDELRLQERRNREKLEDLMVKLLPVNYAAVKDMSSLVKRLLSSRGTVNVDERTNTLILKDIASVLDEAVALVKAVDTETPQVMIEAKIVEANLNFSRELGSSWNLAAQPLVDPFGGGGVARDDLGSSNFRFHGSNGVAFSNPITSTPTALADLGAYLLDEKLDLNVALRAAESMGEGKVISSPRVVTLDNGEATIEQGVSIPFQTFEGGDAKLEFIDAVLSLKVVPHITSDRSIIMDIEVTRNAPDDSVPTPTGSPAIAKAEASTETLVKDGQTLVLGGIYTIDKSERESRVPYLYRLPVIGAAFRSKELTDIRKELLIFVTPRIVKSPTLAARK